MTQLMIFSRRLSRERSRNRETFSAGHGAQLRNRRERLSYGSRLIACGRAFIA